MTPATTHHNWMYGKALYLEVRDTVLTSTVPLSNLDIRRVLVVKHSYNGTPAAMSDLYERISRTTNQLHLDGYLDRTTVPAKNRNPKYVYTPKHPTAC